MNSHEEADRGIAAANGQSQDRGSAPKFAWGIQSGAPLAQAAQNGTMDVGNPKHDVATFYCCRSKPVKTGAVEKSIVTHEVEHELRSIVFRPHSRPAAQGAGRSLSVTSKSKGRRRPSPVPTRPIRLRT